MTSLPLELTEYDRQRHACEECGDNWATHVDSQPDRNVQGINQNECGYSRHYYCTVCARYRFETAGNTSRMTPITEVVSHA